MLDFRFSIKELGMSEEAQGWDHKPTVAFFLGTCIKVWGKIA